jgi:GTP-binding protein EngB required for normal cell division
MANMISDELATPQLSAAQTALVDTVYDVRKHGISHFVDLPQIIVIGNQGSGKSSVLEAISSVRFPIEDSLCPKFVIELILCPGSKTEVDAHILPTSYDSKDAHLFNQASFDKDKLPGVIEQAKKIMVERGLEFSEATLRVKICAPGIPHLILVDLPGFYDPESEKQAEADRVERLAKQYMADKNSIILEVVSARNPLGSQKVLTRVSSIDTARQRTLGIITNPDALIRSSQHEADFIRLAKNLDKSYHLALGWHVLRNRSRDEETESTEDRDKKEKHFFQSSSWSVVPSRTRGIGALRGRLSQILLDHAKSQIRDLIVDIESKISEHQARLKLLSEPRSTPKELRAYLNKIAAQFQVTCLQAVDGDYSHQFFGMLFNTSGDIAGMRDEKIRKLRAVIRDLNRLFTHALATRGSKLTIVPSGKSISKHDKIIILLYITILTMTPTLKEASRTAIM